MPPIQIPISSPVGGINRVVNREGQSPENCWDALNVLPFDRFGRHRVSQRPGLAKLYSTALGSTAIQGLLPIYNISYAGGFNVTHTQPFNVWTNVPASSTDIAVSTNSNTLVFSAPTLNQTVSLLSDLGPMFNSTVLNDAWQLSFDVNCTNMAYGGSFLSVYVPASSTAVTFGGTPRMRGYFQIDPITGGYAELDNSTGGTTGAYTNQTIPTPSSTAIPCSIQWDASGNASATMSGKTTNSNYSVGTGGVVNIPRSGDGYHFKFFAQLPGTGIGDSMTVSNIVLSYGASTLLGGAAQYQTLLIAVCGGYVWRGDYLGNVAKAANGQAAPPISSTAARVSMAYADGVVFIADGSSTLWTYTILTDTVAAATPVASPGNITGTVPTFCNLVANWRGRVVLAGDSNNPQNVYFARPAGTYYNIVTSTNVSIGPGVEWDYSQSDPAAAFASNLATSGKIGQPVVALIPFSDDYLKIGCSHSLWMYQGDPADGGTCVRVSDLLGIVGKDAWCIDPAGSLWFVATGGLFSVRPAWEFYRPPEPITVANVNPYFDSLNPSSTYVSLCFDADSHYLHCFMSPVQQGSTLGTHLTLDARNPEAYNFWPQQFPSTAGPAVSCIFMGDANPNNRAIAFGGQDGFIRAWGNTVPLTSTPCLDDDGTAIDAYLVLGPYAPVPGQAAVLSGVTLNLAETPPGLSSTSWNVNATLLAGPTAYDVTEGASGNLHAQPTVAMTLDRRQKTFRQRLRGGFFTIRLQNTLDNDFFGLESGVMEFMPAGQNRLRR